MGAVFGARHGPKHGPRHGVNNLFGPPFPTTQAGWAAMGITAPTYIFPMQESATPLVCTVTGEQLALSGTGGPDLQVDGYPGRKSMHFDGTNQQAAHASAAFLDIDANTSLTVALAFVMPSVPASTRGLFGKRNSVAPLEGYIGRMNTDGTLSLAIDSGTPSASVTTAEVYADGLPHGAFFVHDEGDDSLHIFGDLDDAETTGTGAVLTLTNPATFRFGSVPGTASSPSEGLLIAYAAVWLGTALTSADFARWWRG